MPVDEVVPTMSKRRSPVDLLFMIHRLPKRRGVSPVISSIILTAMVIAIGGAIWSYTQGASTVVADDYVDGVMELLETAAERFTVEFVSNNSDCSVLRVWIFNYGDVNVSVDVYAHIGESSYSTDLEDPVVVEAGALVCANVTVAAGSGDEVGIKVHSRRQNNAYYVYTVP
jgi:flagellin-like protein